MKIERLNHLLREKFNQKGLGHQPTASLSYREPNQSRFIMTEISSMALAAPGKR